MFWLLVFCLCIPLFQEFFLLPSSPLNGYVVEPSKPVFTLQGWFSGEWQEEYSKYRDSKIGFRPWFIRVKNQIDYTAFRNTSSNVVIGKDDWLYELPYINAWKGKDFIGQDSLDAIMDKISCVVNYLKLQHIDIIILIAPNKALILPMYLPVKYANEPSTLSNYAYFTKGLTNRNIPHIDYTPFMIRHLQKNSTLPVYGKYGVHWTYYAGTLAVDSLLRFMEKTKKINLTDLYFDSIITTNNGIGNDIDLLNLLNLYSTPKNQLFAYPQIRYDSVFKTKPNIIAIADSYHDGIASTGILNHVFATNELWYYDTLERVNGVFIPMDLNVGLKQRLVNKDFIIVLYTDQNISRLGGGFFAKMYALIQKEKITSIKK